VGRALRKTYTTGETIVRALDGVDVSVVAGEFLAVMGPSGSGKSTLLHVLGALDTADEGEVVLGGRSLTGLSRKELALIRRHQVGFVFQFFNLVPVLTVEENVVLPARLDGTGASECRTRVEPIFDLLGITEQRDKLPAELSGGEQQRAAIARALINDPDVLLADEPTGNLDRSSGDAVMTLLRRLHEAGKTVVVVTHDPVVASSAQRVVFVRDGKIVDEATGDRRALLERLVELEA
jgi:putative ABC transport system ATP-binding protein